MPERIAPKACRNLWKDCRLWEKGVEIPVLLISVVYNVFVNESILSNRKMPQAHFSCIWSEAFAADRKCQFFAKFAGLCTHSTLKLMEIYKASKSLFFFELFNKTHKSP